MHQAGMIAALIQHLGDDRLLADVALGNMLNRDPGFRCQQRCLIAHLIAQRHRKVRVVENTDLVGVEEPRHPTCVADGRKRPGHNNPVVTGQHTGNPVAVAFHKRACHKHPRLSWRRMAMLQPLWFRFIRLRDSPNECPTRQNFRGFERGTPTGNRSCLRYDFLAFSAQVVICSPVGDRLCKHMSRSCSHRPKPPS